MLIAASTGLLLQPIALQLQQRSTVALIEKHLPGVMSYPAKAHLKMVARPAGIQRVNLLAFGQRRPICCDVKKLCLQPHTCVQIFAGGWLL